MTRAGWGVLLALGVGSQVAGAAPWSKLRELSVTVGAGVEGYTLNLAPLIEPGVTYGVMLDVLPPPLLGVLDVGLEAGFSGAVNGLDTRDPQASADGVELVRHGFHAAATVALFRSRVRPYVMGGLGLSVYNIRGTVRGFGDDLVGNVPLGLGVRASFRGLTADARLHYTVLFDQRYVTGAPVSNVGEPAALTVGKAGRYSGTLNLGVTW
ncbi:hypothetical protein [Archangium violaceum]|uniref:Outer membrane protein beta-barrel domain-containing protein n=1 Tax=Archangium violaceum Cb vi76 TaxID=1406225 RepID=A0A084SKE9_9BACT|nr:hypothetical protein [Archangium violaceum]KFA88934.1 hypothetical protein Q664_37760 [Archangium violaceum Cb vi76]